MSRAYSIPIQYGPNGCQVNIDGSQTCRETQTLEIIKEFNRVYESKLHELGSIGGGDNLPAKLHLQQDWIRDLTQQNEMLVRAVEELEKDAADRVCMLEERLENGAQVMQKYKDYFSVYLNETFQKMDYLNNDVRNLVEFIKRVRDNRQWSIDGLQFYTINAPCLLKPCNCFCDCPTSLIQNIPVQDNQPSQPQKQEIVTQDARVLDTKLKEMEKRLSQSPTESDVQELSFKLRLKDEELSSFKRKVEEQCRVADEQIKCKEIYIKELLEQINFLKEKRVDKDIGVVGSKNSSDNERFSSENDHSVKYLSLKVKRLNRRCQEQCQKSFMKDIIIKDVRKEMRLLKKRIIKLEDGKICLETSKPASLKPILVPRKKTTNQSKRSNLTSNCTCGKPDHLKRTESPETHKRYSLNYNRSSPRSFSPPCFPSRPESPTTNRSLCFCPKRNCQKLHEAKPYFREDSLKLYPLSCSELDIVENAELDVKLSPLPKKVIVSSETRTNQSPNLPYLYLCKNDITQNSLNAMKGTFVHKNSQENFLLTSENCFYSSNTDTIAARKSNRAEATFKQVLTKGCCLTSNKILHEYYGISDSSGSHGVIKNFQEVNLVSSPKRIPIKTYINNLELNIKKSAEPCIGIKKKAQSPTKSKNKKSP